MNKFNIPVVNGSFDKPINSIKHSVYFKWREINRTDFGIVLFIHGISIKKYIK